jgi:hypothetical protein
MGYQRIPAETLAKLTPDRLRNTSVRKLATEFKISKSAVHKLRVGISKPAKKGQIGRPRKSTQAQRKAIKAKLQRSGIGTRKLAEWCADRGYPRVSRGTVGAVIKGGTAPWSFKSVKSGRRLSDRNKSLRLRFVNKHLRAPKRLDLDHNVFIDQKSVCIGFDEAQGYQKRWQKEGSTHIFAKSSNPQTFMFYAAVAKGHKSDLVMVPMDGEGKGRGTGGFNSATFVMVMKELWKQVKGWYPEGQPFRVVLDHAKQHASKLSKAALAEMGVPLLEGFPPQSYVLNLIEVAWAHLQQQLQGRRFKKKENYEKEIREAWGRVKQSTIDQLVGNHMQQFQRIKDAKGGWVQYKDSGGWCLVLQVTVHVPLNILAH